MKAALLDFRRLNRPLPCIIEHIKVEPAELTKTKAWVEARLAGIGSQAR